MALEIADQANDETWVAFGRDLLDIVARRTGCKDTKAVGRLLGSLARKGIELRVPIIKDGRPLIDKQGRVVFAQAGHQTTYRIPRFGHAVVDLTEYGYRPKRESGPLSAQVVHGSGDHLRQVVHGSGDHSGPAALESTPSAPTLGAEWSTDQGTSGPQTGGPVVHQSVDPSPHISSRSPHLSSGVVPSAGDLSGARKEGKDLDEEIAELLAEHIGRPVDRRWGERVCRDVLDAALGRVRDPRAYVRAAVSKDPGRYAPQAVPWDRDVPETGPVQPDVAKAAASRAREQFPNLRKRGQPPTAEERQEGSNDD